MSEQQSLEAVIPGEAERRALLEAVLFAAEEPLTAEQIASGLDLPKEVVQRDLDALSAESHKPERGVELRKVAGGYRLSTKAEHHDAVRKFVKTLRPKLKLSLPALETLAVIAYKQPITLPEIQAIRGVNASGVVHTLLNHKLITTAGRKQVVGKPIMYKTTKEFLVQFGLNDLSELPSLKELEELSRAALGEEPEARPEAAAEPEAAAAAREEETEASGNASAETGDDGRGEKEASEDQDSSSDPEREENHVAAGKGA